MNQATQAGRPLEVPVQPELAEALFESFRWSDTPQGHAYWEERFWALLGAAEPMAGA
ncbi:hypothetical protein JI739_17540 [Ramlibacter sp. AW1]|uniref:Uncharacterized protein n=1 Tax=Ramlibacter aurantiacus TaxID=2801330 RepID=A0A936ZR92_9BURK|nr:hypothetical protein [Ramlibacter aurantiacus]MBL0422155.1 hypothetical protein [Ramlibacter aurantiacus]